MTAAAPTAAGGSKPNLSAEPSRVDDVDLLARAEERRIAALACLDPARQAALGQYFTPAAAARRVAALPRLDNSRSTLRVLDPGAGAGILTAAIVDRLMAELPGVDVHVVAVEADETVASFLADTLADCEQAGRTTTELIVGDYVTGSTGLDADPRMCGPFDLVIMNPPYGKLAASDSRRQDISRGLVDVPNLYAAFWALGVAALAPRGQCVAIVPRSWANGQYFEPFRRWLLNQVSLDTLHVFESRSTVFADTGVLQENVIVSGTAGARGDRVVLSASVGHVDEVTERDVPASAVVWADDPHRFVRFTDGAAAVPASVRYTLQELGLTVSTGRVVDFRSRELLLQAAEAGTEPLVYPGNVRGGCIDWPRAIGKPQYLKANAEAAQRLLVPPGVYPVIKRFSAKEEKRRVVAGVWDLPGRPAFENHLNYIHDHGGGLSPVLARGIVAWLSTTALDDLFRTFSGNTQVNATDLRVLPFPPLGDLLRLGMVVPPALPPQAVLDALAFDVLRTPESVAS